MKKLLLMIIGFLTIILLNGCSEALNCNQCATNDGTDIGVLPNGAVVYISKNNVSIDKNTPAQIKVYVVGGSTNEDFNIEFGDSQLQSVGIDTDNNGITVSPKGCVLNNYSQTSCTITISASATTQAAIYAIPVSAIAVKTGKLALLSRISVLVSNPASDSSKDITTFIIGNVQANVDQESRTITMTLPYGTNPSSLVATYVTTGVSVSVNNVTQQNGVTANNFTNPVLYVVHAEDGSTKEYAVTVTVAPSTAKQITEFILNNEHATINQNTHAISLVLPYGTDLSNLVATFTTTGVKVLVGSTQQTSGLTPNSFVNPIVYTVYAADGSQQPYTVNISTSGEDSGGGWKDLGNPGFSNYDARFVNMVIGSNGLPYVGYRDNTPGLAGNATVQMFESPIWNLAGNAGFTSNGVIGFGMAISATNTPYIIYENDNAQLISMNYINSIWSYYPNPESSLVGTGADFVGNDSMAIDPITNQPVFAYVNSGNVNIVEYNSVSQTWAILHTVAGAKSPVIAFDANGILYLSYISTNSPGIYVESSNAWGSAVRVDSSDSYNLTCSLYCMSIAVNPQTNQPSVAYKDNSNYIAYTNYNGSTWSSPVQVSNGTAETPDMAFNSSGKPYIAFKDYSNQQYLGYATVMTLTGATWTSVGESQFSHGEVNYLNLVINPQNQRPYVAYQDMAYEGRASVMYFAGNL